MDRISKQDPQELLYEMRLRRYAPFHRLEALAAQTLARISRSQETIKRSRQMIDRSLELLRRFRERP